MFLFFVSISNTHLSFSNLLEGFVKELCGFEGFVKELCGFEGFVKELCGLVVLAHLSRM